MMKNFWILLGLVLATMASASAQDLKILNVEEDTEGGIGVYPCGDRHEAMVQFITSESFGLEFRSNYDKDLVATVDSVAGKKTYTLIFVTQAPGVSYEGRRLTVMAPGFRNHMMTLNLRDKQKFIYIVSDPYSALRSPFFVYQEKANDQFYDGQYQRAKDTYQMIRVCPEYESSMEYIEERISLCDSMIQWSNEAMQLEHFARFADAADVYSKIYMHNSSNSDISSKIGQCRAAYNNDCESEYLLAEHYMDLNQIDLARESYQRVIDKKCSIHLQEATSALSNINKQKNKEAQHARCFFYEFGPNQPIGFTYAQCYSSNRRSSGYITVRTNADAFRSLTGKNALDGQIDGTWPEYSGITSYKAVLTNAFETKQLQWRYKDEYKTNSEGYEQPKDFNFEAGVTFGWTIRIWNYFFAQIGLGYHGGGFYTFDTNSAATAVANWRSSHEKVFDPSVMDFKDWNDNLRNQCMESHWFHGTAGELGLIVKAWRLNLKATYQHTFWLNDTNYKDFLDDNKSKIYFGVGFNW